MKLATTSTSPLGEPGFSYEQMLWGDLIYGTKEQLQRIGLAVGMAFPGEPGGPKRRIKTTDHRDFPVQIAEGSYYGDGIYSASISFPGRCEPSNDHWVDFAPGVRKNRSSWVDEYVGTAVALANAGLVRFDQLPGQPGMRKTIVTIFPDGTLPIGPKTVSREPGAKRIQRRPNGIYLVYIYIDLDEEQRRDTERQRKKWEFEDRMQRLPRPAPLIDLGGDSSAFAKEKPAPKYRAEGNVLHLLPRSEGRAAL